MLINIFGNWINPDYIVNIKQYAENTGVAVKVLAYNWVESIIIPDTTPDEVAAEINKQIKENKWVTNG